MPLWVKHVSKTCSPLSRTCNLIPPVKLFSGYPISSRPPPTLPVFTHMPKLPTSTPGFHELLPLGQKGHLESHPGSSLQRLPQRPLLASPDQSASRLLTSFGLFSDAGGHGPPKVPSAGGRYGLHQLTPLST